MPPELRDIIKTSAEGAKGAPWIVAYNTVDNFHSMLQSSVDSAAEAGVEDVAERDRILADGNRFLKAMVTALLECMDASPRNCSDPFQAAVYKDSDRKDFRKAAKRYLAKIGGPEAAARAMQKWAVKNPEAAKNARLASGLVIEGATTPSDGPPANLEKMLDDWTRMAREHFGANGEIEPLAVGQLPDGSQVILRTRSHHSKEGARAFRELANDHLNGLGALKICFIAEVWIGDGDSGIPASQSESRREALYVSVTDGDTMRGTASFIDRDWKTGKPTLSAPEKVTAHPRV